MAAHKTMQTTTILKAVETGCLALGPAITAYYLFSFTVDKFGYYYKDTEFGIAMGIFVIALGRAIRYWRS